ncbi:PX domain-containing protein YPT35 [Madurella mycetomatis]|uniref:Endosomal/vacuolar adapter protein YPT35 n=1 Tax=Madurella mycetomatis TaxID=100816 RepID=A0A175WF17_9PEZI|nr:PX domain-containing protein YPT35 [Madurella mycetomatis]
MASEIDQAQRPQPPAQQPHPPSPTSPGNGDHSTAAGLSNGDGPKPNGAAQQPLPRESETDRAPLFPDDDAGVDDNVSVASEPASERVVSPSVSSPPYWTHTHSSQLQQSRQPQSGHSRAVSSASAESVLPPGAITLQDNERDDEEEEEEDGYRRRSSNSSEVYGRDRNRACWAKSVQVTDYVMVNGSTTNIGAFVVWIIRVETLNGSYMNIRKRYSEFDDLRRRLVQTFPSFEAAVPVLPPKSVLNRFRSRFLEKRRAGLQYFLNCILLNPEFSGSPVLKEFLFS